MKSIALCAAFLMVSAGAAFAEAKLDWMTKAFGDGRHNAFNDLIQWKGRYYLCFRHGASHLSMDGEIRILRSTDLKTWEPCGVLDTLGDDRDPHFTTTGDALYVFFGTWDLAHATDNGVPGRGKLRSHMASSQDGEHWSKVQGLYESRWWLWRVRWHEGRFYSIAYHIVCPESKEGEAALLVSEDGVKWASVGAVTKDRLPDEADIWFHEDGSMTSVMRTCDKSGVSMLLQSDPSRTRWTRKDLDVLIHCPVMCTWKNRCFVAGRGKTPDGYCTRVWELAGDTVREQITLPSAGDTAYPGMLVDPDSANADRPSFYITWYSQHERDPKNPDEASVYVGHITLDP